jgi:HKD family nuclease
MVVLFAQQPGGNTRLGDFLQEQLRSETWTDFRAGIAFVKISGVQHIAEGLELFGRRGGRVRISAGIDFNGTSAEGLRALLEALGTAGEVWIFHNEANSTYHPKMYLFSNETEAQLYVGSGNLTNGGLYTNYEAGLILRLDLAVQADGQAYKTVVEALEHWAQNGQGTGQRLTEPLLARLIALGYVPPEARTEDVEDEAGGLTRTVPPRSPRERLFPSIVVPSGPRVQRVTELTRRPVSSGFSNTLSESVGEPIGFVMTLQQTDMGTGQVTSGTSRRSPEIFIPLAARDLAPGFWGFPNMFVEDSTRPGKFDRHGVSMRIGGETIQVNMMTWPDKHDFRLRSEALRSAGNVGDLLRLESYPTGSEFEYYAEVIPAGTSQYDRFAALCVNPVRNSNKRFGYY